MRFNLSTDYAFRIILYLAKAKAGGTPCHSSEIAISFNITQANVTKIVNRLKHLGIIVVFS